MNPLRRLRSATTPFVASRRLDYGWALVILLSLVAMVPLAAPGFFLKAHDATIGAYFLWQFDQGLADGALYPRWAMDWTYGYGYPVFVVIAPLAFYVAEVFHLFGAGIIGALKIVYALSFLVSGLTMYALARELFGRAGGLLAAALYVYAPYHLADIYVRGDLAEFAAFAFFPAILWALFRLDQAEDRTGVVRYAALAAILYGCLILTHITMAMIFTPLALAFALLRVSASPRLRVESSPRLRVSASLLALALGAAISAAYLLPGFLETRYLQARDLTGGYFGYANHYVYPFQFLSPLWDYGYAAIGPADQMPYQLGVMPVVLAVFVLWAWPHMNKAVQRQVAFFLGVTIVAIFAMLSISQPLWDLARPVVAFVQFPWRLLSITSASLALVGGALVARQEVNTRPAASLLIVLTLLASFTYATPQHTDGDVSLAKMIQFQLDTKELLGDTIWVTERPEGSPMVAEYLAGQAPTRAAPDDPRAEISVLHRGGRSYEVSVTSPAASEVLFRIRYFPGWRAYVDGKSVEPAIRPPQGLMAVAVDQGTHRILLRFEDTSLRLASKLISLVGLLIAGGLLAWTQRAKER